GLLGQARPAVRLLHAGDDPHHLRVARQEPEADRGGDPPRPRGKHLPLHGLPQHRQGGARGRREAARGEGELAMATQPQLFGQSIKRREDPRLISGKGTYVDDVKLPNTSHAAFVRSPHAHARIKGIDTTAARNAKGVVAIFTGKDLVAGGVKPLPVGWLLPDIKIPPYNVLAADKARYLGDADALVVAETPSPAPHARDRPEAD